MRDARAGDPFEVGVTFGQMAAECLALPHAVAHEIEGDFRLADRAHAMMDAAGPQPSLCHHEAIAFRAEQVFDWNAHILKAYLAMAFRREVIEDIDVANDGHAGRVARDQNHALLPVRLCLGSVLPITIMILQLGGRRW